jgi:uncharacterized protein
VEGWQGLAQFAVGLTHVQRGNAVGAVQLLTRAAARVEGYSDATPYGVNVVRLVGWARDLVARIQHDGLAGLTSDDLMLRLRS